MDALTADDFPRNRLPDAADKRLVKIAERMFRRYRPAALTYSVIDSQNLFQQLLTWMQSSGWQKNDLAPVTVIAKLSHDTMEQVLTLKPHFLILHFSHDKLKRQTFPRLENKGYRMVSELGDIVLFSLLSKSPSIAGKQYRLDDPALKNYLGASFWSVRKLPPETKMQAVKIPAMDLLRARRFDIAMKLNYGRLWRSHAAPDWREYIYKEQALRITGAGNDIKEHDGSGKQGLSGFIDAFHDLLAEKDNAAFPPFVIDREGVAIDGAHRIATGILNGGDLSSIEADFKAQNDAGAEFFGGMSHGHAPCPEDILDEAAIEYCLHSDTTAIALIFPSVSNHTLAIHALESMAEIVYRKTIVLSPEAGGALLAQAYLGQPWLTLSGQDTGFQHKKKSCFPFTGPLTILLIDHFRAENIRPVKERIRNQYGIGNHSLHVTDSAEETLRVARALFNANSVQALNTQSAFKFPDFHAYLSTFRDWILFNDIDENKVCVDSSAVLSALGLRECKDLDFLYHGDEKTLPPMPEGIDCHNSIAGYCARPIADIVGDPRLHFWYMGVKFCAPFLICSMKKKRGEPKDKLDVALLESIMPAKHWKMFYGLKALFLKNVGVLRARLSLFIGKVKNRLRPYLRPLLIKLFPNRYK